MTKPKIAFYWSASCGGCEEAVVDLGVDLLALVELVDVVFWPVALDFKRTDVEALADGELAAAFLNGAVRTSEQAEMVELLRRKAAAVVAFGSCATSGGVPGLANLFERDAILDAVYREAPSVDNHAGTVPVTECRVPEGTLRLPEFDADVRTLDQVVDVDYYLPGCPPPPALIKSAALALVNGTLPEKGSVLAPDVALCAECPRAASKPERLLVHEYRRPHETLIDPDRCLLAQGIACLGPATRARRSAPPATCRAPAAWGRRATSSTTGPRRCRRSPHFSTPTRRT